MVQEAIQSDFFLPVTGLEEEGTQQIFLERRISSMETGTIKWFNSSKGYGFITREEGDDVLVHYNAIEGDGYRTLEEGDKVEFEIEQGPKGLQASKVNKI